jgi:hypothetical protein
MDDELNHILFEIDQAFGELKSFRKAWLDKDYHFAEHNRFVAKERYRWTINDLLSYMRALRDRLENG